MAASRESAQPWYRSKRILVRPLALEDIGPAYEAWFRDPVVRRFIRFAATPPSLEDLRAYWRAKATDRTVDLLGLFDGETGEHVGNMKFELGPGLDEAHVGFLIGKASARRQGMLRETLDACITHLRRTRGPLKVYLTVHPENTDAIAAFMRLGFRRTSIVGTGDIRMDYDGESRPTLCLALMHDYAARDFLDSGVLTELAEHFALSFVSTSKLTLDLSRHGPVFRYREPSAVRTRVQQLARGLWHMHDKRHFEFNRSHALARATFGAGPLTSKLIRLLSRIGLAGPVASILRGWLRASTPSSIPEGGRTDALLVYTSVNSYFADDLLREARSKHVPALALTNNWDNLNTKSFLETPPYLGVWGEQGFLIARLMHRMFPHQIFVIGAPRFEVYRKFAVPRAEARRALALPAEGRVLLFCGSGVSFEETSLIEELEGAIAGGRLPPDLHVLYKPHPLRFERTGERQLDFFKLRHVTRVTSKRGLTELELYPYLMAAADAVISPFSTMVMEGAHHGLPALCLGYNDEGHANHDWDRVSYNLHLYVIRHSEWALVCDQRPLFIAKCEELLGKLGDPRLSLAARSSAAMVFHVGEETVAQSIARAVRRLMAGLDADESHVAAQRSARAGERRMTMDRLATEK